MSSALLLKERYRNIDTIPVLLPEIIKERKKVTYGLVDLMLNNKSEKRPYSSGATGYTDVDMKIADQEIEGNILMVPRFKTRETLSALNQRIKRSMHVDPIHSVPLKFDESLRDPEAMTIGLCNRIIDGVRYSHYIGYTDVKDGRQKFEIGDIARGIVLARALVEDAA